MSCALELHGLSPPLIGGGIKQCFCLTSVCLSVCQYQLYFLFNYPSLFANHYDILYTGTAWSLLTVVMSPTLIGGGIKRYFCLTSVCLSVSTVFLVQLPITDNRCCLLIIMISCTLELRGHYWQLFPLVSELNAHRCYCYCYEHVKAVGPIHGFSTVFISCLLWIMIVVMSPPP